MGKKAKKSESGIKVITTSPKQEKATVKILGLAPEYGIRIVNAPRFEDGRLSEGQRAVQKQFKDGEILFSMWADKEDGGRVLAALKKQENALSVRQPNNAIRTVKL